MLWLALAESTQLVLREHLDFAVRDGCRDLLDGVCRWLSIVNNDFDGWCVGENAEHDWEELRIGEDADAAGLIERMGETRFTEGAIYSCDRDPYGYTGMLHELPCGSGEV